jgi:DNA polymerase-3 subunit delta
VFIFLYGPDIYRSKQKIKEIIKYYKESCVSGLNLRFFEGENLIFQNFLEEIQQVSIFNERKLLVLKNSFSNKDFKKSFLKNSEKFIQLNNIILFYEEKEMSQKDPLFVFLKKEAKCQEFKLLNNQKLGIWIEKEFSIYKKKISQNAIQLLIDFVGNNLWQLSSEIKKLANYKREERIGIEEIELLVNSKIETDIFKTIEAMAMKNKKQALILLHKHLEKGDNSLYLLSMISFQFRNLLIIKELIQKNIPYNLLAKESKLHPFIVRKIYSQTQKFELEELKKIYQKIFQIDLKIKTGKIEPQLALDLFIAEI